MLDSGILKDLVEKFEKSHSLLITILVFVGVNILVSLINVWVQYKLKRLETRVHSDNIKESKRIEIMHELYRKMDLLRNIFNDDVTLQRELQITSKYINENSIYLKDNEEQIARNCCDYFSTILVSNTNKDIAREKIFMKDFKSKF
ncbi:hypothetical protein DYU11_07340 [Fibrisoma montanum]|uniref:Uncharacterized protein n=1 Tax=Fibrisoma montanum TaxID=2305895 RepID=A0A418MEI0_9BACT|nr:hypothetical protein [Fibrisoma montanum]RIV25123.1 hypothetical protein DYU11_07340 [Fibrisoma montanum]